MLRSMRRHEARALSPTRRAQQLYATRSAHGTKTSEVSSLLSVFYQGRLWYVWCVFTSFPSVFLPE